MPPRRVESANNALPFVGRSAELAIFRGLTSGIRQSASPSKSGLWAHINGVDGIVASLRKRWGSKSARSTHLQNSAASVDILHVTGLGGMGKSELLESFGAVCDGLQIPWVHVEVDQEPAQVMLTIARGLSQYGEDHGTLGRIRYQEKRRTELGRRVDASLPRESLWVIQRGIGSQAEQARSQLYYLLGQSDADFYLNPTSAFGLALRDDLRELAEGRGICIMLDRYERASRYLDEWMRSDLVPELFPRLQGRALVVLAGRRALPDEWKQATAHIRPLALEPLAAEDVSTIVQLRGVTNDKIIHEIVKVSHGLPLAANMAVDLLVEGGMADLDFSEETEFGVVEQIIRKLTEDAPRGLWDWIEKCAIVRWFNQQTLASFLNIAESATPAAYARLRQLSFVKEHPNGLALHDLVRELISEQISTQSPERFASLNSQAAAYYDGLIAEAKGSDVQPLIIDLVFHLLRADERIGLERLRETFETATDFSQVEYSAQLLETTRDLRLQDSTKLWLQYFEGVLWGQRSLDNYRSVAVLTTAMTDKNIQGHPELIARVAAYLAIELWYIGEHDSALHYAQVGLDTSRSHNLSKFANRSLEALGLTYNYLGRWREAIDTQRELLEWTRQSADQMGQAWALNNVGFFNWHAGHWTAAEQYLIQCESLMSELRSEYGRAYPVVHRGFLYAHVGRLDEAERILGESLRLSREQENIEIECQALENLADLRRMQLRYDEAMHLIEDAQNVNQKLRHVYFDIDIHRRRGDLYLALGRLNEAAEDYAAGLEEASSRGMLYLKARLLANLNRLMLLGWQGDAPSQIDETLMLCQDMGYYNILSELRFTQGSAFLNTGDQVAANLAWLEALISAMKYNRYLLYDQVTNIVAMAGLHGSSGVQILDDICRLWATEIYQGKLLIDWETMARVHETGLAPLPLNVIDQIKAR